MNAEIDATTVRAEHEVPDLLANLQASLDAVIRPAQAIPPTATPDPAGTSAEEASS